MPQPPMIERDYYMVICRWPDLSETVETFNAILQAVEWAKSHSSETGCPATVYKVNYLHTNK